MTRSDLRSRRKFLQGAALGGAALVAAACAPSGAPSAPSTGSAPAGGSGRAAWQDQWDALVEAAKKEGVVTTTTYIGTGYRELLDGFEKAFPGIKAEFVSFADGAAFTAKVAQERQAGVYTFDAAPFSIQAPLTNLKPIGAFDPIRDFLFRPDITEDKNWRFGFDSSFVDADKKYVFCHEANVRDWFWVNTDVVKPGEIKTMADLFNPKWKGQIISSPPESGTMINVMTALNINLGPRAVEQFVVDMQPTFIRDNRQLADQFVRGNQPIVMGMQDSFLAPYKEQGMGKNLARLSLPEARVTTGPGIWLFNKPAHPNAAKLFVNWFLTKDGQEWWVKGSQGNSLRTDVTPTDPDTVPTATQKDSMLVREANFPAQAQTRELVMKLTQGR